MEEKISSLDLIEQGEISGRKALEILDNGEYLYHGSSFKVEELEPRQAYNWSTGEKMPDGDPVVFATDNYERAIFMAVLKELQGTHGTSIEKDEKTCHFRIDKRKAEQLKERPDVSGYVMVLPKKSFTKKGGDYRSKIAVSPQFCIKVTKEDLPENIEIIEDK